MSDDDRFEEFLKTAAQEYHRPPGTPREAMWARIEAARRARTEIRAPQYPGRHWWRWVTGIAAILLLGIAIGRFSVRPAPTVGVAPTPDRGVAADTRVAVASRPGAPAGVKTGTPPVERNDTGSATSREPAPTGLRNDPVLARGNAVVRAPYRLAALQHLSQAEVLLTSVRADTRRGQLDAQVSNWARDLLSTTRLLLDSPAAGDAQLRRLLGDLELVLAQIAQLPAGRKAGELDLIDQAMAQRDVLFRLRTTVPPGTVRAGT